MATERTALDQTAQADLLGDEIGRLAAELTVGEHRLINAIGEFDAIDGWARQGALTYGQWLSWRIGVDPHTAREKIRVAKRLRGLPRIDAAFAEGKLSYSKVRALTRVADQDNEAELVNVALYSTGGQLARLCRRFATVVREDAPSAEEIEARRFVRHQWTDDGMLRMTIQLPPDEGARLLSAIESAAEVDRADRADEAGRTDKARRSDEGGLPTKADGLMVLAESFFADGARPRRGGAPNEVVLHVPAETLHIKGEGAFIENHDGPAVSPDTARKLTCDAGVTTVVRGAGGEVLDIGRKTRTVPAAMRRALDVRDDRCCSFPGCERTLYLDAHHIEHWIDGGATKLENLCLLCRRCHAFVHDRGLAIEHRATGSHVFRTAAGEVIEHAPAPPAVDGPYLPDVPAGPLDPDVLFVEGMDYVQVIDAVCANEGMARARRLSRESRMSQAAASHWAPTV